MIQKKYVIINKGVFMLLLSLLFTFSVHATDLNTNHNPQKATVKQEKQEKKDMIPLAVMFFSAYFFFFIMMED